MNLKNRIAHFMKAEGFQSLDHQDSSTYHRSSWWTVIEYVYQVNQVITLICAAFSKASARERSPTRQYLWRHFLLFSRRTFAVARLLNAAQVITPCRFGLTCKKCQHGGQGTLAISAGKHEVFLLTFPPQFWRH